MCYLSQVTSVSLKEPCLPTHRKLGGKVGRGQMEMCSPCFLNTTFGYFQRGQEYCTSHPSLPLPCCRLHMGLRAKVWPVQPSSVLPHPQPAGNCPQTAENKKQRQRGLEQTVVCSYPSLYWWLRRPLEPPPACSGQPLAHTLIGHTSDGGDLKEAARTERVSAGASK